MRGPRANRAEEHQVARGDGVVVDRLALGVLLRDRPWHVEALLGEDVGDEAAAVEAGGIAAAVSIWRPAQRQRRSDHGWGVNRDYRLLQCWRRLRARRPRPWSRKGGGYGTARRAS